MDKEIEQTTKIKRKLSYCDAAYRILKNEQMPLRPSQIIQLAISQRLIEINSKRPNGTMSTRLWLDKRFDGTGNGKQYQRNNYYLFISDCNSPIEAYCLFSGISFYNS